MALRSEKKSLPSFLFCFDKKLKQHKLVQDRMKCQGETPGLESERLRL